MVTRDGCWRFLSCSWFFMRTHSHATNYSSSCRVLFLDCAEVRRELSSADIIWCFHGYLNLDRLLPINPTQQELGMLFLLEFPQRISEVINIGDSSSHFFPVGCVKLMLTCWSTLFYAVCIKDFKFSAVAFSIFFLPLLSMHWAIDCFCSCVVSALVWMLPLMGGGQIYLPVFTSPLSSCP